MAAKARNDQIIEPDPQDFEAVEREYGRLPRDASDAEYARHYRLAQAGKLMRLVGVTQAR